MRCLVDDLMELPDQTMLDPDQLRFGQKGMIRIRQIEQELIICRALWDS